MFHGHVSTFTERRTDGRVEGQIVRDKERKKTLGETWKIHSFIHSFVTFLFFFYEVVILASNSLSIPSIPSFVILGWLARVRYTEMECAQKYRMVAFDLDGTLLAPNHQITAYAVQYLRSLHERGFIVSIATGRSPAAIAEVIRRLNFDFPKPHSASFPVVSTNGAKGIHVSHEPFEDDGEEKNEITWESNPMVDGRMSITELFHQPVPLDLAKKAVNLAKSLGCTTNYYINHEVYAEINEDWNFEATEKYSKLTGVKFTYSEDDYEGAMKRGLPSKLLVLCKEADIDMIYQKIEQELGEQAKIIRGSPPFFVEILEKEVCKGNGLELLCKKLNVGLEECM